MSEDKTGGPAFPRPMGHNGLSNHEEHRASAEQGGMELRDYFAAAALTGLLGNPERVRMTEGPFNGPRVYAPSDYAAGAYSFADAMIARRKERR